MPIHVNHYLCSICYATKETKEQAEECEKVHSQSKSWSLNSLSGLGADKKPKNYRVVL